MRYFCVDGGRLFVDTLTIENGFQPFDDGGAVFLAEGTFDARRTLFVGNRARNGGAIAAISTIVPDNISVGNPGRALTGDLSLFLFNSTLSENEALGQSTLSGGNGGAIYFDLDAESGATIRNTTIARNSVNDTAAPGTGAGLFRTDATGDINIENTLFSSNFSNSEVKMDLGTGATATFDSRNSLYEDLNGVTVVGPGNIVTEDARIGFLENNGGPTRTQRPFSDSPAINAGDNGFRPPVPAGSTPDTLDQRGVGFARIVGTRIDIGAVEFKANTTITLRSSKNPSRPNQLVTFTATVRSTFQGTPTGSVAFYIGRTLIGRVALVSSATASIPVSNFTTGRYTIVAVYEPQEESGFDGARALLIQTVTGPGRRWLR
jgi:predicted outer membrane repeat protein